MTLMVTLLPRGSLRGAFMHLCPNLEEVTMKTNSKLAFPQLPQRTYISKSNLMYEYSLSLSLTLLYTQSESHLSDHASILNRYCHFDSLMEFCCLKVVCYFKYLPFSVNVLSASFQSLNLSKSNHLHSNLLQASTITKLTTRSPAFIHTHPLLQTLAHNSILCFSLVVKISGSDRTLSGQI